MSLPTEGQDHGMAGPGGSLAGETSAATDPLQADERHALAMTIEDLNAQVAHLRTSFEEMSHEREVLQRLYDRQVASSVADKGKGKAPPLDSTQDLAASLSELQADRDRLAHLLHLASTENGDLSTQLSTTQSDIEQVSERRQRPRREPEEGAASASFGYGILVNVHTLIVAAKAFATFSIDAHLLDLILSRRSRAIPILSTLSPLPNASLQALPIEVILVIRKHLLELHLAATPNALFERHRDWFEGWDVAESGADFSSCDCPVGGGIEWRRVVVAIILPTRAFPPSPPPDFPSRPPLNAAHSYLSPKNLLVIPEYVSTTLYDPSVFIITPEEDLRFVRLARDLRLDVALPEAGGGSFVSKGSLNGDAEAILVKDEGDERAEGETGDEKSKGEGKPVKPAFMLLHAASLWNFS
ncbi:hypothetical protein RQP46_009928 [Phenoliferia psychrophenolica]